MENGRTRCSGSCDGMGVVLKHGAFAVERGTLVGNPVHTAGEFACSLFEPAQKA